MEYKKLEEDIEKLLELSKKTKTEKQYYNVEKKWYALEERVKKDNWKIPKDFWLRNIDDYKIYLFSLLIDIDDIQAKTEWRKNVV